MRVGLILAAFAACIAAPAAAEVKVFARAASWEAFGGIADDGHAVCGVSATAKESWFTLKYFKGDKELTVQLGDSDWVGKPGDKVKVGMKFDDHKPWSADAKAFQVKKETALQFAVDADQIEEWMNEFMESHELFIVFAGTNVPSWHADLTGTKAVGQAMSECVEVMVKMR